MERSYGATRSALLPQEVQSILVWNLALCEFAEASSAVVFHVALPCLGLGGGSSSGRVKPEDRAVAQYQIKGSGINNLISCCAYTHESVHIEWYKRGIPPVGPSLSLQPPRAHGVLNADVNVFNRFSGRYSMETCVLPMSAQFFRFFYSTTKRLSWDSSSFRPHRERGCQVCYMRHRTPQGLWHETSMLRLTKAMRKRDDLRRSSANLPQNYETGV